MITNTSPTPASGFVLVLLDGTEKDILGIWGPYASEAAAQLALKELNLWPIDGIWDLHPLKYFPMPGPPQGPVYRAPTQRVSWGTYSPGGTWS